MEKIDIIKALKERKQKYDMEVEASIDRQIKMGLLANPDMTEEEEKIWKEARRARNGEDS